MNEMDELRINFKDYMFYTLKHWKWLFLVGVLCALLVGGLVAYKKIVSWDSAHEDYDKQIEEYNEELAEYNLTLSAMSYGQALSEEKLKHEAEYMGKSIKIGINPYNMLVVRTEIMLVNEANATASDANTSYSLTDKQILKKYYDDLYNYADWNSVGQFLNTEGLYAKELVSAIIDYDSMTVELSVIFPDEGYSYAITDILVNDANDKIDKNCGYKAVITGQKTEYIVDSELDEFIQEKWDGYERLIKRVNDGEKNIEKYEEPTLPSNDSLSKRRLVVKIFIFGLIGFVFGICIMFVIYYNKFVNKGIIYSAEEFERLSGIKNIGVFETEKKKNKKEINNASAYNRVKICIDNMSDINNILVICQKVNKDNEVVSKLKNYVEGKQLAVFDDITDNKTLEALYNCDGVVFVFEKEKTMLKDVIKAKKFVEENCKKALGSIVL